jgi:tetratricopeptide (TPR) repeat protein
VSAPPDDRRLDRAVLEEEREFFLRSLRDLEAERAAGDLDDLDYQSLRDDYTVRAAEVVRQLAALREAPPPRPAADPDAPATTPAPDPDPAAGTALPAVSPWRRRIIVAAAVLIVIAGVAVAVIGLSKPTQSGAVRVEKFDIAAESAFLNRQYETAVKDYEAALKIAPTDVLTLTGEGEVLVEVGAAGHAPAPLELGLSRLQSAEIADPAYGPAFGARGIGLYDEGDYAAAIPQFETYLSDTPKASWSPTIITALATSRKKSAAAGS